MYCVYILLNEAETKTYTGVTDDVEKRLKEHNSGRVKSSTSIERKLRMLQLSRRRDLRFAPTKHQG
ncbi:MAG: GIY-YIG nuclease family protein [Deltaproteobacteria bacterium]|nr:GIY-YIG nuclease family protein [Deltaproteobacteria bacterium]